MSRIPKASLHLAGNEEKYVLEAIRSQHLAGDGPFTRSCSSLLEKSTGCQKALLTHSCTAALEMAAMLCDIKSGDEVIMPSFTFSSTATAFVRNGATPVFIDIDKDTLNADPRLIAKAITPKTKAVVPVHYAGVACDMDSIMSIAAKHGLFVIEDAAQGLCAAYKGRALGGIGHLGCLSFHESKNIQCGEGGALLINDARFMDRAHIIREKGTNRTAFFQGAVDKYTWVDQGSSFLPSELNAAFLLAQLEEAASITAKRMRVFARYRALLAPLQEKGYIRLPDIPAACTANAHIFYILTDSLETRIALSAFLKEKKILCFFHYIPLHSASAGRRFGRTHGALPHTEAVAQTLLRLPLHPEMPEEDIERVSENIHAFYTCYR